MNHVHEIHSGIHQLGERTDSRRPGEAQALHVHYLRTRVNVLPQRCSCHNEVVHVHFLSDAVQSARDAAEYWNPHRSKA